MPSIRSMFSAEPESEETWDMDQFLGEANKLIDEQTPPETPTEEPPAPETPPAEPEEEPEAEEPESVAPEAPVLPAAADPLAALSAERRAALLALNEVLERDPVRAESVLRGLSAPAAQAPQLPEEIDPASFEATIWRQQQETNAKLDQLAGMTTKQQEQLVRQATATAAQQAGTAFATKYDGKLDQADVIAIAKHAGQTGIAARFAQGSDDLVSAYDQALEHVLWTNDVWRNKVLEAPVAPAPGETPEAKERKRKLSALSSAASPVSGSPSTRSPLESREDGRLTPQSRMGLVRELANGLARGAISEGNT